MLVCFRLISLKFSNFEFEMGQDSTNNDDKDAGQVTEYDMDKLRSTIKQFVREWAIEVKNIFLI